MERTFTIEESGAEAQRRRFDPPEPKQAWQQKGLSLRFSGWRRLGVRVILLRAKRRAKHVR
jgi:hypothetical protein